MTDRPKTPFEKAVHHLPNNKDHPQPNTTKHIRDKDNAGPDLKPDFSRYPARNLAPKGAMGIKRNLLSPIEPQKHGAFTLNGPGDLTREFVPLARDDKDRGRDR